MNEDFGIIYDQYVTKIYRFIVLKVSSREVAEDLCSEVFVRALNEFQKKQIENTQAFLYQIARHIVVDYYREKIRFQMVSIEDATEIVDSGDSVLEQANISSEMEMVKKALATLPDEHQNLVIWRYLDELSIPEIAQITGKTEGNVRVGVHRALQALKAKMEAPQELQAESILLEERKV